MLDKQKQAKVLWESRLPNWWRAPNQILWWLTYYQWKYKCCNQKMERKWEAQEIPRSEINKENMWKVKETVVISGLRTVALGDWLHQILQLTCVQTSKVLRHATMLNRNLPSLVNLFNCQFSSFDLLFLYLQGDANRSYSDDDHSSSNFDESEKHDSIKLSGENWLASQVKVFVFMPFALFWWMSMDFFFFKVLLLYVRFMYANSPCPPCSTTEFIKNKTTHSFLDVSWRRLWNNFIQLEIHNNTYIL